MDRDKMTKETVERLKDMAEFVPKFWEEIKGGNKGKEQVLDILAFSLRSMVSKLLVDFKTIVDAGSIGDLKELLGEGFEAELVLRGEKEEGKSGGDTELADLLKALVRKEHEARG